MIIIRAIVEKIVFANEDEEILSLFKEYGFNLKADLKENALNEKFLNDSREEILLKIRSEMADGKPQYLLEENGSEAICVIKERYPNKKQKRGSPLWIQVDCLCGR